MGNFDRGTALIWGACALLVLGLGGRWLLDRKDASPSAGAGSSLASGRGSEPSSQKAGTSASGQEQAPTQILIHVVGAVRRPGVYRLAAGARVYEAVRVAGGSTAGGDQNAVDLAARAVDGSQIVIPKRGAGIPVGSGAGPQASSAGPVSLGSAKLEDLDRLDGIGPALAARIIQWRDAHGGFRSVADLDQVPGIGPAKLASLRPQVVP